MRRNRGAVNYATGTATSKAGLVKFYMTKVLPWPIDELLTAAGLTDLIISHIITIGVGLVSATSKWWLRV